VTPWAVISYSSIVLVIDDFQKLCYNMIFSVIDIEHYFLPMISRALVSILGFVLRSTFTPASLL
jgi:hypothetical protein